MEKLKPFHESIIESLMFLEQSLLSRFGNGITLVTNFEVESRVLLSQIKRVYIPEQHLAKTAKDLKEYYEGLAQRTPRLQFGLSYKTERDALRASFDAAIADLGNRHLQWIEKSPGVCNQKFKN